MKRRPLIWTVLTQLALGLVILVCGIAIGHSIFKKAATMLSSNPIKTHLDLCAHRIYFAYQHEILLTIEQSMMIYFALT